MKNLTKNIFVVAIAIATVAMSFGGFVGAVSAIETGDLVKGPNSDAVYYIDGMTKYVFPGAKTYFSWYSDFSNVQLVTVAELDSYTDGGMVLYRPGTKLITHPNTAKVYAVEPAGNLRWVPSEEIAAGLFGADWASRVNDVNEVFFPNYTVGSDLASATDVPNGSLVMMEGSDTIYYIDGMSKRPFASMDNLTANNYDADYVLTVSDLSAFSDGTSISGMESSLMDVAQGGSIAGPSTPVGSGLTVALASDSPATASIIADSTAGGTDGAQAMAPMMKVNFTAASDGDVTVKTVKFKRSGIPSADADFSAFYLYDGNTMVAEYASISSGVLTFTNSAGLFTVAAGTTKSLTLKMDVAEDLAASRVSKWSLLDSSYVDAGASAINGSFPIDGNQMSSANVTDLGNLTIANSAPSGAATVNAGELDYDMWRFTLAAEGQDMELSYIKFTNIGTIANNDVRNITLKKNDGTQYGDTLASFAADGTLTFDLSSDPITVLKGNTNTFSVRGDVIAGTNRTFRLSVQQMYHMVARDTEYGVFTKANLADSWTIIQAGGATTVNAGTVTVSRATDSPSGNVPLAGLNVEVARINFSAVGENVKISSLPIRVTETTDTNAGQAGLYAVKAYVDGSQIGSTTNLVLNATDYTFSFGNNFIIPAGETKTLVLKADIKDGDATAFDATDSFTLTVNNAGTATGTGVESLSSVSLTAQAGNLLTVSANTLTAAKNAAVAEWVASNPTGVAGSTGVMVGSFVMTAGSSEGVNISSFAITDETAFGNYQNLMLKKADGTQIGTTQASLTAGTSYNFTPSSQIALAASESMVFNLYADIKSSASNDATDNLVVDSVSGTGATTNTSANYTGDLTLQTLYIVSGGSLTTTIAGSTPASAQLVTGSADNHIATFSVEETTGAEDVTLTKIIVKNSTGADTTLMNWSIYDGETGAQIGSTVPVSASGVVTFNAIDWLIPAGSVKTFKVKAGVSAYTAAVENTANYVYLASGAAGAFEGTGSGSGTLSLSIGTSNINANSMMVYRTVLTAAAKTVTAHSARSASQDVFKVGLVSSSNYNAKLRAASTADALTESLTPTLVAAGTWTAVGTAAGTASLGTTSPIIGSKTITNTNAADADADDGLKLTFTDTTTDLTSYSKMGMWVRINAAVADLVVTVNSADGTDGTTAVPTTVSGEWQYVEVALNSTMTDVDYLQIIGTMGSGKVLDLDNVRFYNDSVVLDVAGDLLAGVPSGETFTMKDASGSTKMIGYYSGTASVGTVTLLASADIAIGSTEQVFTVYASTTGMVKADTTASEVLSISADLGDVSTAGDFRWYDGAVTATSPITWVSGDASPITFSFNY